MPGVNIKIKINKKKTFYILLEKVINPDKPEFPNIPS